MNKKRLLNKSARFFLDQLPAENILPTLKSKKQDKKVNLIATAYSNKTKEPVKGTGREGSGFLSKRDRLHEVETQIVRKFVQSEIEQISSLSDNSTTTKKSSGFLLTKNFSRTKATRFANRFTKQSFHGPENIKDLEYTQRIKPKHFVFLSVEHIRDTLMSRRMERQKHSELRNHLLESKKIRSLYGDLPNRQLRKSVDRGKQLSGNPSDNLFVVLESRLDVVLHRCCFFSSIRSARQGVLHKRVEVNFKTIRSPGYQLSPGDIIKCKPLLSPSIRESLVGSEKESQKSRSDSISMRNALISDVSQPYTLPPSNQNALIFCLNERPRLSDSCKLSTNSPSTCAHSKVRSDFGAIHVRRVWQFLVSPAAISSLVQMESLLSSIGWNGTALPFADGDSCHAYTQGTEPKPFRSGYKKSSVLPSICSSQGETLMSTTSSAFFALSKRRVGDSQRHKRKAFWTNHHELGFAGSEQPFCSIRSIAFESVVYSEILSQRHKRNGTERAKDFHPFGLILLSQNPNKWGSILETSQSVEQLTCRNELFFQSKKGESHLDQNNAEKNFHTQNVFKGAYMLSKKYRKEGGLTKSFSQESAPPLVNKVDLERDKHSSERLEPIFDAAFFKVYLYWLQVKKRLISEKKKQRGELSYLYEKGQKLSHPYDGVNSEASRFLAFSFKGNQTPKVLAKKSDAEGSFKERKSNIQATCFLPKCLKVSGKLTFKQKTAKALHIECSYQSYSAIFLYPPQRIHLAALVDADLIMKRF